MQKLPFSDLTTEWFIGNFGGPTPVQEAAWPQIAAGRDTLVSAPTGTGKTLSAFLVFIDRLSELARQNELNDELYLIYISPLKSLAGDIRENLRKPLDGISRLESAKRQDGSYTLNFPGAKRYGSLPAAARITIGVRTGDTIPAERRAMFKNPPHILITTPESLYILLTSLSGVRMLKTAKAVIIDELHALIGSKRGSHLMFSLARLDVLCGGPLQRIGLSATIEPLETAARYLSAGEAAIAAPKSEKAIELSVKSAMPESGVLPQGTIWPEIAREVYMMCQNTRCVIAFVESRMHAEKLAYNVNLIAGENFALTHHGSVSKERRLEAEQALRDGKLRLLCATSSMELGIDVGDIDRVIQIGCPRTVSSTLQRLGRAGHNPGRVSVMRIFPRTPAEGITCGITAELARIGVIEPASPPVGCLDVLSQHLVSMAASGEYTVGAVLEVAARAYPFAGVTAGQVDSVLKMLAGDYEHGRDIPARPRLLYDRVNGRVRGDSYSRLLALSAGGTIPDRGLFAVRGDNGVRYGEVDEEFVFEARVGDKFLLGAFAWRIQSIGHDEVIVAQSSVEGVQPPFWKGEVGGRALHTGLEYGKQMRAISDAAIYVTEENERLGRHMFEPADGIGGGGSDKTAGDGADGADTGRHTDGSGRLITNMDRLDRKLYDLGLDTIAASGAKNIILRQVEATGALPDDRTIIIEHFSNEVAEHQLVIHSVFGKRINSPLALLAREVARRILGSDVGVFDDDDGFLLFPVGGKTLPDGLLFMINPDTAVTMLDAMLPSTTLFSIAFRYNAARALMMGVRKRGRQPLWIQRQRSAKLLDQYFSEADHPLISETKRECMENYWDVPGLEYVLQSIRSGVIAVRDVYTGRPSPFSLPMRRAVEAQLMYDYTPTAPSVEDMTKIALEAAIIKGQAIAPGAVELEEAARRERELPDIHRLHSLLMTEGDQLAGETDAPIEWFEELAREGRALYIEPGLWIAAEHAEEYASAFSDIYGAGAPEDGKSDDEGGSAGCGANDGKGDGCANDGKGGDSRGVSEGGPGGVPGEAKRHIVRRALRYHGGHTAEMISDRYSWPGAVAGAVLRILADRSEAVVDGGIYYHAEIYERARRNTVFARRAIIRTQPPEKYAAMLAGRAYRDTGAGTPVERAVNALRSLFGQPFPAAIWESVLLPWRVSGYRPELLDSALSRGEYVWRIGEGLSLAFYPYDDIDWDSPVRADIPVNQISIAASVRDNPSNDNIIGLDNGAPVGFDDDESIIINALEKRGALFTQGLSSALDGRSPYDALLSLVEKGVARSDSFIPVRQLINKDMMKRATVRQRAQARAQMLTSGRWELARESSSQPMEEQLNRAFDRSMLLCRETAGGLPWLKALEILRVWEYTGLVRRGYYVEGLSGAQFVRDADFAYVTAALAGSDSRIVWLPAPDPAQPWGKCLPHLTGRAFMNLPGTAVCLRGGVPYMVFERQGQVLRVFSRMEHMAGAREEADKADNIETAPKMDGEAGCVAGVSDIELLAEALKEFADLYSRKRLFGTRGSLVVKQYPPEAAEALVSAGFTRYMQDYTLYRK